MKDSIRAIIIDDENHAIEVLKGKLETSCPSVNVIATTRDPNEGIKLIKERFPDLVFLDIKMEKHGINGFQLHKKVDHIPFHLILVTSYNEFASEAYQAGAIHYLLKPVDRNLLKIAVDKVVDKMKLEKQKMNSIDGLVKVALPSSNGNIFVDISSIVYAEVRNKTTMVVFQDRSHHFITQSLQSLLDYLNDYGNFFFRTHHSYLINLNHTIEYINGNGGEVIVSTNISIPVAKNRKKEFLKQFGNRP